MDELKAIITHVVTFAGGFVSSREFLAGLVATLVGVLAAFRLERRRERLRAREQYARHLSVVWYESEQLRAVCEEALVGFAQTGAITTYEMDAPALRGLVSGPELQEHAPHGLAVVLISLVAVVGRTRNGVDYYRRLLASAGGASVALSAAQAARLTKHLTRLRAGIESAQGVLDAELARLGRDVMQTKEDTAAIQAFRDATK